MAVSGWIELRRTQSPSSPRPGRRMASARFGRLERSPWRSPIASEQSGSFVFAESVFLTTDISKTLVGGGHQLSNHQTQRSHSNPLHSNSHRPGTTSQVTQDKKQQTTWTCMFAKEPKPNSRHTRLWLRRAFFQTTTWVLVR